MRHRIKTNRLDRFSSLRKATVNSLVRSAVANQSVRTTYTKAKAASQELERLISLAKENTVSARRQAYRVLLERGLVSKLFSDVAALFKDSSNGGYTRVLKLGPRRGDGAMMALLELTHKAVKEKKVKAAPIAKEHHPPALEEKPHAHKEEKPEAVKKKEPAKKFFGGLRGFFKKERDSL